MYSSFGEMIPISFAYANNATRRRSRRPSWTYDGGIEDVTVRGGFAYGKESFQRRDRQLYELNEHERSDGVMTSVVENCMNIWQAFWKEPEVGMEVSKRDERALHYPGIAIT
jgi:hypothetical protein